VSGTFEAGALAGWVLDPARSTPIVCVTARPGADTPFVPVDPLVAAVGGRAEVWALTSQADTWALSAELPDRFDVYGGATRIWLPIDVPGDISVYTHPLILARHEDEPDDALSRVIETLDRLVGGIGPKVHARATGSVEAVDADRARIRLSTGQMAICDRRDMALGPIFDAREALTPGMLVQGEITATSTPHRDARIDLRPFAPRPWERVAEVYRPGMIVEGVVVSLFPHAVLVEILPGACGMVYLSDLAVPRPDVPEDIVLKDDRVLVRLQRMDPEAGRAALSMVDVPDDAEPEPPASVYPDGPPWLTPMEDDDAMEPEGDGAHEDPAPHTAEPAMPEYADPEAGVREPAETGDLEVPDVGHVSSGTAPVHPPPPEDAVAPGASAATSTDDDVLEPPIVRAERTHDALRQAIADADGIAEQLRDAAETLAAKLAKDIADAEARIHRLDDVTSSAATARITGLMDEIQELSGRLESAERDRRSLLGERKAALEKAEASARAAQRHQAQADGLRAQLADVDAGDPSACFLRELGYTWGRLNATEADRTNYPYREPVLGPRFLTTLDAVQGISRDKILEVCAHVVSYRAFTIAGFEVHQLRTSQGGDSPPRKRDDGATAWRVSLQVKTPSARRLHYWQLVDGTIELAQINTHDDLSIT